jgi:hypothetical protein
VIDDRRTAALLNDQFVSVFTNEDLVSMPEPVRVFQGDPDEACKNINITPDEVKKLLIKLDRKKTPGVDGLLPGVLRELEPCLSLPSCSTSPLIQDTCPRIGGVPMSPLFTRRDPDTSQPTTDLSALLHM